MNRPYLTILLLCLSISAAAQEYVTYYFNDAQGTPIAATNEVGQIIWKKEHTPYGEDYGNVDDKANRIGFTGHVEEEQFNLVYMQQRWYDPAIGRFYSIDPVGFNESSPMSFNRYMYGNNNPYKFVDPNGRDAVKIEYRGYMVNTGLNGIKLPLGHAGALLIDNNTGNTKYYEFGRYDKNSSGIVGAGLEKQDGNIRNIEVSNAVIGKDGKPTQDSLSKIYGELSAKAGQGKPVDATYVEGADYNKMQSYVSSEANNKDREHYSLSGNNCKTFKDKVVDAGK